jgi:outer membrane protein OmpA-like peptidoglycan-associated protein
MENIVRKNTTGTIEQVNAQYHLLRRGSYVMNKSQYQPVKIDPKGPLQLAEARNAVEIARLAGADRYAAETLQRAELNLRNAEDFMRGKHNDKAVETNAREATQTAEDARVITYRKLQEEELARHKADAERAKEVAAQQAAAAAQAQAERAAAERAKAEADAAAARARQEKAEADAARQAALQQQQQAQAEAARAQAAAQQAENDRNTMRERLRQQLSAVMETRETARGLIVNISDVLFDFNKYTLKPAAREKMAKVAGILLAYPGLTLRLEGHTDSVGSDEYNIKLSQERADAVRDYLVEQGVPDQHITAVGRGKGDPVASNDTAAGRQQNRRVELVVSGDVIGVPTGAEAQSPTLR